MSQQPVITKGDFNSQNLAFHVNGQMPTRFLASKAVIESSQHWLQLTKLFGIHTLSSSLSNYEESRFANSRKQNNVNLAL